MAETIVKPAAPEEFEQFGSAVASHRDTLVVGAQHDLGIPGRVYVFVWNGAAWTQQAKLQASDLRGFDKFGAAVALEGDCLVVGAPSAGPQGRGHAYVFRRTGTAWAEEAVLIPSVAGQYGFGQSVAIYGGEVLVGAHQSAYFFARTGGTWAETAQIAPAGALAGRFGNAVGLHGDHAVVGDDWGGGAAAHQGAAYVYRRNAAGGWDLVLPILTAPDATSYDEFGRSVAIYGDRLIVGAPGVTGAGVTDAGAAYVYVRAGTSWGLEQKLEGRDVDLPHGVHDFGTAVSLAPRLRAGRQPDRSSPASGQRRGASLPALGHALGADVGVPRHHVPPVRLLQPRRVGERRRRVRRCARRPGDRLQGRPGLRLWPAGHPARAAAAGARLVALRGHPVRRDRRRSRA